jgi:hypothetical protein
VAVSTGDRVESGDPGSLSRSKDLWPTRGGRKCPLLCFGCPSVGDRSGDVEGESEDSEVAACRGIVVIASPRGDVI